MMRSLGLTGAAVTGAARPDMMARKDANAVKELIVQFSPIVWRVYTKMAVIEQMVPDKSYALERSSLGTYHSSRYDSFRASGPSVMRVGYARKMLLALGSMLIPIPAMAGEARLNGLFRCGFTDYMWPTSAEGSPTSTGTGVIEFASDGNGMIESGNMTESLADDTRRSGDKACSFTLTKGDYRLTSPNSGTATMTWKLKPGSDPHCGGYPNLGRSENGRDYLPFSTTGTFFIGEDGTSKWVSTSDAGVSIGFCGGSR
jgi:hypothetical protein